MTLLMMMMMMVRIFTLVFSFLSYHSTPQLLILNDCNIDRAGEPEDLKKKCRIVKELDLAQNKLNNWNEVGWRL